jgi:recombination protein RecT
MAHLVPFGKKVTFIPGYMGLIDLAMRSGKFRNIEAHIVYAKDSFSYEHGSNPHIHHKPAYEEHDRGEQVAAYCIAFYREGGFQFRVLPMSHVKAVQQRSPAGRSGPWITDFDAMALKTAIRHSVKYLPSSVVDNSLSLAVSLDERAEAGIDQQLEVISGVDLQTGEIIEEPGKTALDKLADAHGAEPVTPPPEPAPVAPETDDEKFIAEFFGLRTSGFSKYLLEDENVLRLAQLPQDSPVIKELDAKHTRFWGTPWPRPSFASPQPSGPLSMVEPPVQPPGLAPQIKDALTERAEHRAELEARQAAEGQPPLFGEGQEPEEATAEELNEQLASIERTLEIDKFVRQAGIQLKTWHDWAILTKRMVMGRYTGYFSHCFATDPDTEFTVFGTSQQEE